MGKVHTQETPNGAANVHSRGSALSLLDGLHAQWLGRSISARGTRQSGMLVEVYCTSVTTKNWSCPGWRPPNRTGALPSAVPTKKSHHYRVSQSASQLFLGLHPRLAQSDSLGCARGVIVSCTEVCKPLSSM